MENGFSSANYPNAVPEQLTAGSRWAWTRSEVTTTYPTASYTLKYRIRPLDLSSAGWEITASKIALAHVVEVSQATTKVYQSSECEWSAVIVRDSDSEEITIEQGHVTIRAEYGANPGTTRSWVYETLAAIRLNLKGTASKEQAAYSIGGRSLSLRTPAELLDLEREFSKRWRLEKQSSDRAAGRIAVGRVLVKMSA